MFQEGVTVPITIVKIIPDNTSTLKEMKVMLIKKLAIDPTKFELVIASLGKSKIFRFYEDSVEA